MRAGVLSTPSLGFPCPRVGDPFALAGRLTGSVRVAVISPPSVVRSIFQKREVGRARPAARGWPCPPLRKIDPILRTPASIPKVRWLKGEPWLIGIHRAAADSSETPLRHFFGRPGGPPPEFLGWPVD